MKARRMLLGGVGLLMAGLLGVGSAVSAMADDGGTGGQNLQVQVIAGDNGGSGGGGGSGGSGGSGSGGSGGGDTPVVPVDTPATTAPPVGTSTNALLSVSGLTGSVAGSINPFGGDVTLSVAVTNNSTTSMDGTARFWVTNIFGATIAESEVIPARKIAPGSTREISTQLTGLGQWTVLFGHVTFTPPKVVDGTSLSPVTRDTTLFALPWLTLTIVILAAGAVLIIYLVRANRLIVPTKVAV